VIVEGVPKVLARYVALKIFSKVLTYLLTYIPPSLLPPPAAPCGTPRHRRDAPRLPLIVSQ
jgi:hypothetical protein